jgi:tetratricopeptide (TPR) repeat protein
MQTLRIGLGAWLCVFAFAGPGTAQGIAPDLAQARAKIDAGEGQPALELLLGLQARATSADEQESLARAFDEVGKGLTDDVALETALRARSAALAMWQRLHGDVDHEQVASSLNDVAMCLQALGRDREALPQFEAMVAMTRRLHGEADHPQLATGLNNLALCLENLGRPAEALTRFEAALAMGQRLAGTADDGFVAKLLDNIAICLGELGRSQEALSRYETTLAMRRRLYGDADHPEIARTLSGLGVCLQRLGRTADALPSLVEALAMRERLAGGRDHPSVAHSLGSLASSLGHAGRMGEALTRYQAALAMWRRLHGDRDHPDVAVDLGNVAHGLRVLDRPAEAQPLFDEALAMWRRLYGDADHPLVAACLTRSGTCLAELGRFRDAQSSFEAGLAMRRRLFGDGDHPDVAESLVCVASGLQSLGRVEEALPQCEAALAMCQRVFGAADHPHVAMSLRALASCRQKLGYARQALPGFEAALAMLLRLHGGTDRMEVASALANVAGCCIDLGRVDEALPRFEAALAMSRRLHGDGDHLQVAGAVNNVAFCLDLLGRTDEALPQFEAALGMRRRHFGGADHLDVALSLNNLGSCCQKLGRPEEALRLHEEALAMWRRLHGDGDHALVATGLENVGSSLRRCGRHREALAHFEAALAMGRRLHGDVDHPEVARSLGDVAAGLRSLGRAEEAMPLYAAALTMRRNLHGDVDHPDVVVGLTGMVKCLEALARPNEALPYCLQAAAMIERLRDATRVSAELRQSFFDELKERGVFEQLQAMAVGAGAAGDAMHAAERSRSRDLLDLLELQRMDAFRTAQLRAERRGDAATAARIPALRDELDTAELESDRLLDQLAKIDEMAGDAEERTARRDELVARSNDNAQRRRRLLDEKARLFGAVLPVGHVNTPPEIQSALRSGELLLEFTIADEASLLYLLGPEGAVEAIPLPAARAAVDRLLPDLLRRASHVQLAAARGRDPGGDAVVPAAADALDASPAAHELFASLIPSAAWQRIRQARRVFLAAHRELHRLPFELLVTERRDGNTILWLENGPPISYVPSGTVLRWLRARAADAGADTTSLDLLAVGDPGELAAEPEIPEQGVFVIGVNDGGEGARLGLLSRDVLLAYDGQPLSDDKALRDRVPKTEDGVRADTPIPIEVWRRGRLLRLEAKKGRLGISVGPGGARLAAEAALGGVVRLERITRSGDLERLHRLPSLRGARAETEAIEKAFTDKGRKVVRLAGAEATEPAVFDLAAKAKYLHFACHGIAEEYAGQSLSMLVLSQPDRVLPGDDGLLKLGDLTSTWVGRLSSCRLVVLSACRTNVGPTLRDEAPRALSTGFLLAGAPTVVSSLWAVDDASTRELMTDFHVRLLAGETDKLKAFTDAKKALRAKYRDPFHWAPFLFIGSPD